MTAIDKQIAELERDLRYILHEIRAFLRDEGRIRIKLQRLYNKQSQREVTCETSTGRR